MLRYRKKVAGQVRALTAQVRLSGLIITLLPIGLAIVLMVISPDYFTPMIHEAIGILMLAVGAFSLLVGLALMRRLMRVDI
jgi:tight adherence protein B